MLSHSIPRRLTLEHEAAHAIVAKAGGGTVEHIDLAVRDLGSRFGSRVSLGSTSWKPPLGNSNTLIAGYVAGPAQHAIACKRLHVDAELAEEAVRQEAKDIHEFLLGQGGTPIDGAGLGLIEKHLPAMTAYLECPGVQVAIQSVADYLEKQEGRVEWESLAEIINWKRLPALPVLQ